jgi:hypothetical protein
MIDIEHLKFPIGRFVVPESIDSAQIQEAVSYLIKFSSYLETALVGKDETYLDTPYRPGGWTIKQVIHHLADSHMNAFIRFKLALTEENPTVKGYDEAAWANLPDAGMGIESSMAIIKAVHEKWGVLLSAMTDADFRKTFFHSEKQRSQSLAEVTLMYAWHGMHHLAHVQLPNLQQVKL